MQFDDFFSKLTPELMGLSFLMSFKLLGTDFLQMGGLDDHRGRGLLPSPSNPPLLGAAPVSLGGRNQLFQQRLGGNPWNSSFQSNISKGLSNSSYFPSNKGGFGANNASSMRQNFRSSSSNAIKDRLDRSGRDGNNKYRSRRRLPYKSSRSSSDNKKSDTISSSDRSKDNKREKSQSER